MITYLGHSTVLFETDQVRILIDPGNFSSAWHGLRDLDAIVVTHGHGDHIDPENLPDLLAGNPQAQLIVEPTIPDSIDLPQAQRLSAGSTLKISSTTIEAVGGLHAIIHCDIPRIGNVGVMFTTPGEPTLFHPGDALDTAPRGVDILAIPAHAPWCAMKETIEFVREVDAPQGFLIHDGLINERGWNLTFHRLGEMTNTHLADRRSMEGF
ncbi:MAG: MBL fold metallo-hydrolase [Propionibacteriaceae bacterium]|jgi:L-ascorbate metabolism protein UlaG (beta-lactamase superfamily)|nr:MBL fold metallo-hydrolase [Propionibacteriaceae bacterium]